MAIFNVISDQRLRPPPRPPPPRPPLRPPPRLADLPPPRLAELLDDLGDKLRLEGAEPSGGDTYDSDVGGNADNFAIVFSGTL